MGTSSVANSKVNLCSPAAWLVLFAAIAALTGCNAERRDVLGQTTGKVTFQGKPVTAGEVLFDNGQGIARVASLESDGTYAVQSADGFGLPLGTYKVAIQPPRIEHPLGPIKEPPKPRVFPDIPERFRELSTSGLKVEIKPGANECNFEMKQ